jgi:MYXO-CTERM domain-containing protein
LRRCLCALAALLLLAVAAPGALADGDPASDVLLGESVFYPYSPPVPASLQKQLNGVVAAAHKAGFPIKVALIASPVDLGVIPDLFDKPQKYADFLDQEISFQTRQPLLVVMPAGYGVQAVPAAAKAAAASLPKPAGETSSDLARAAITAVTAMARAAGHPIDAAASSSSSSGSGSSVTLIVIVAAAAVLAAGAVVALRRRAASR